MTRTPPRRYDRAPEDAPAEGIRLSAASAGTGIDAVAAAARRVAEAACGAGGDPDELDDLAARLHALADDLGAHAAPIERRIADMWRGEGVPRHDPATGPENPIAPPLVVYGLPDGSVRGDVVLGVQYQGPPGLAHGGISALLLDHALGVANGWAGTSGFTAHLGLDYRRGVPLYTPLVVTARQEETDGRKRITSGEIRTEDGQVCVEARGLFIAPRDMG